MKGGAAIANILKQEGVEVIFCFPNNPLIDAAAAVGIRPIITRIERTAVNMAMGYARTNGGMPPAVCVFQGGPGIENAYGGVAQAYADSSPILVLPGQAAQARLSQPSVYDSVANYAGVTKWASIVHHADHAPDMLRRAFSLLRTGRPRPVLMEVPGYVVTGDMSEEEYAYAPVKARRSAGDPADVRDAASALLGARMPVIYAGQGIHFAEAYAELQELAELLNAPVLTTTLGKSCFPENHPLALGAAGTSATRMAGEFLDRSDVVFGIGTSFQKTLASFTVPRGKTVIQSTSDPDDLDNEYTVHHAVVGDAKLVLQGLIDEIRARGANPRAGHDAAAEVQAVKGAWLDEWRPHLTSGERPINPYRVVHELQNTLDVANTIITHDSGNPRDQMVPFYETVAPKTYMGWGNSTQLGTGLGMALGAKCAAPDKMVVNVMGDTAAGTVLLDVETGVRERLPILTCVLNNGAMGGYEHNIPIAVERYGTKFLSGDYTGVAAALGAYAERVEDPEDVSAAIARATARIEAGQTAVLEFITREFPVFSRG